MKEAQDDAQALREHLLHTYVSSRVGIAIMGFVLPLAVSIPVWWRQHKLLPSISEYYYSFMGDVFVGALVAIGVSLYLYKGFGSRENCALNIAGVCAVLVAFLPMRLMREHGGQLRSDFHYSCAVLLFLCIGYVCIYRAGDTLSPSLIPDRTRAAFFFYAYRTLGACMVLLPVVAFCVSGHWRTFFVETAGVWVFAVYWALKTVELRGSGADVLAARGKLSSRKNTDRAAAEEVVDTVQHRKIGRLHVV